MRWKDKLANVHQYSLGLGTRFHQQIFQILQKYILSLTFFSKLTGHKQTLRFIEFPQKK